MQQTGHIEDQVLHPVLIIQCIIYTAATAVWSGNEKLNCFNVKTNLTFFTKTMPYIFLFGGTQGISYDQIAPGI